MTTNTANAETIETHDMPGTPIRFSLIEINGMWSASYKLSVYNWHDVANDGTVCEREEDARAWLNDQWRRLIATRDHYASAGGEAPAEITEGFYEVDGKIFKVVASMSSGNLYAKLRDETGGWTYAPGAVRIIRNRGSKLTRETAAQYGKLHGVCCICGRTLTDESSIEAGIGPVCASKQGF